MTAQDRGVADSEPNRAADVETVDLPGDRQLAYTEYGRSDGVPVVFLHGTPGSRRLGALLDGAAADASRPRSRSARIRSFVAVARSLGAR